MQCKQCLKEKELNEGNFYRAISKFGWDKTCKDCRAENRSNKPKPVKTKKVKKAPVKYRKCKSLINPAKPIPIKLTTMDGFGGYYRFDVTRVKQSLNANNMLHYQKNHMVNRKFKCLQVKHENRELMVNFVNMIDMSTDAIITFDKPDGSVYAVNLFHPDILRIVK